MVMFIFIACTSKPTENSVSIPDYRNSKAPEMKPESHKDKDVEIFRMVFLGDMYSAIIYRKDQGKLRGYQVYVEADKNYDKAFYTWTNDSTVLLKLFSSSSDSSRSFSIGGYGTTTSLRED